MPVADEFVHCKVEAVAFGQQIDNTFDYIVKIGGGTIGEWCDAFIAKYRANILPLLHQSYEVLQYQARTIDQMIWLGNTGPTPTHTRPAFRYKEQAIVDGTVDDKGEEIDPPHPTSTAVGVEKICGQVMPRAGETLPVGGEKLIKGFNRFGPILESRTEILQGNQLTAPTVAAWNLAFALGNLRTVNPNATFLTSMVVLSRYRNNVHRSTGVGTNPPTFAYAEVQDTNVNQFITTQTTRKQRSSGA